MKMKLLAVGKNMPKWVLEGYSEYEKRLPNHFMTLQELPQAKFTSQHTPLQIKEEEGDRIMNMLAPNDYVIALDVMGASWSTGELSQQLLTWQNESRNVTLLIGGPEGLSDACLQRANYRWSLSSLTLPHPLVRVILIEQLYRAWSILQNHPYHR